MSRPLPPDQAQRLRALDAARSILVQAPAGSGKTDLLTRRFLRLLGEVDEPGQIVAITFTRAAAAEMRHRILAELERAAEDSSPHETDEFSMRSLAHRALLRSRARGWQLPELPAQLRISTIDSFCRDLAIQQPLLTGLGSDLAINEQPEDLYRRAASAALQAIQEERGPVTEAIESLLLWRDNGWHEMETLLVEMLRKRDRWMHDFVFEREPDWEALRARLERPFVRAVAEALRTLDQLLDQAPHARAEAHALARFACAQLDGARYQDLAELAEFPTPNENIAELDAVRGAYLCLADLLLTKDGALRSRIDKNVGFPPDRKGEKARLLALISDMRSVSGLESALAAMRGLPPARYADDEWEIVRACFTLLRRAAAELRTVFAESGTVDFVEVSQIAQRVLLGEDGLPSDAAIALADGIHHLLVDEFQDTSRRQHRLLASLAAAWPDQTARTIFVVGDPMQSIYFFREADAELFGRVRAFGLETPGSSALPFDFVSLRANFRTQPDLVFALNQSFSAIFARPGGGVPFSDAEAARPQRDGAAPTLQLHLQFVAKSATPEARERAAAAQASDVVELIRAHLARAAEAQNRGDKYRIAVLARTRKSLVAIAAALRKESIPFLAVELEPLKDRPEVLDALALARALLNPLDRVAWLGALRAPWCGLSLIDLHTLTSADDADILKRPIPDLLAERAALASPEGRAAVGRVLHARTSATELAASLSNATVGTKLEQVWLDLGGASCVDATARANLDLLWSCLDKLPNGAQDVLGPALDAALETLTALPDVNASADCGVQLMTIHKSKGLEFEVVLVPDLQARGARTRGGLLSWFERGLAEPDDSGELTEFLVAPLPTKGSRSGEAKAWVDRVFRERESQEMRRILYVAATRAREELHLFARPSYKEDGGELILAEPADCLLATAWPAFEDEVRAQFDAWRSSTTHDDEEEFVPALAAQGELVAMKPTLLHRLPVNFVAPASIASRIGSTAQTPIGLETRELYTRHEGGLLARVLGTAVHSLLEELARLRATLEWPAARDAMATQVPRIAAQIRSAGAGVTQSESIAQRALALALAASRDPHGQWVLAPHQEAASEAAWSGVVAGALRTVRVDRIFRAGLEPLSTGSEAWWIVDYKTAHADGLDPAAALPELRRLFAPQLEAYAAILRQLHGAQEPMRAALYYPRMAMLDWWEIL